MVTGAVLVFVPSLGSYLTPDLLGGGRSILIGNVIQNQFTLARDWPFGAALSMVLMALVLAILLVWNKRSKGELL
jgi:spermidine/putrescine transport system permease protein